MNEGRCDERLKARVEECTCLTYTGLNLWDHWIIGPPFVDLKSLMIMSNIGGEGVVNLLVDKPVGTCGRSVTVKKFKKKDKTDKQNAYR
jgi:hypothetical protein